jgi:predicted metal-dependent HD superfamily phosphohydrolase
MDARRRWLNLWGSLGGKNGPAAYDELVHHHAESVRSYHTLRHVLSCLRELGRVRGLCARPAAVELALWFHDAIYDPRAKDNEARSAALLRKAAVRGGVDRETAAAAAKLVLATAHFAGPTEATGDAAIIRDIDLAILGAPRRAYAAYERGVRREYGYLGDEEWAAGRSAVLTGFLSRAAIYGNGEMHARLERRARRNMTRSVTVLTRAAAGRPASPPAR